MMKTMQSMMDTLTDLKKTSSVSISDMNDVANTMLAELEKKKFNMLRFKMMIGLFVLIIVLALYDVITSWMSGQVNVITEKSLEDEEFRLKIEDLCKTTITTLANEPQVREELGALFRNTVIATAKNEEVQKQITNLLEQSAIELMYNANIQQHLNNLLRSEVESLLHDTSIQKETEQFVSRTAENASKDVTVHQSGGRMISGSIYYCLFGNKE
jgi:hypothetical protein